MRGNVGFSRAALGQVRLTVGEGITGRGGRVHAPDLGRRPPNARVLQALRRARRGALPRLPRRPDPREVGSPGRARRAAQGPRRRSTTRHRAPRRARRASSPPASGTPSSSTRTREHGPRRARAGGGTRKVTLPGAPVRRPAARSARSPRCAGRRSAPSERRDARRRATADVRMLRAAFDVAEKAIGALAARAKRARRSVATPRFLATYIEILGDARFRERAARARQAGRSASPAALGQVAREVTRTAASLTRDAVPRGARARRRGPLRRARRCSPQPTSAPSSRRRPSSSATSSRVFDLLISRARAPGRHRAHRARRRARARARSSACSASRRSSTSRASSAGPRTATSPWLDADHGLFVINPSKSEIAAVRKK